MQGRERTPVPPETSSGGNGRLPLALSAAAITIAIFALILSIAIPGPEGRTGPPGPAGPTAGRTIAAYDEQEGGWTINATCTHYANAEVSITVPGPGTIVAYATIQVTLAHASGIEDLVWMFIGVTPADCTLGSRLIIANVEEAEGDGNYIETVPGIRPLDVSGPGTYSFYVTGFMQNGQSQGDEFTRAELVAVFYPQ
jgi:hypothetical protein